MVKHLCRKLNLPEEFAYAYAWGFHYVPWKEKPDLPFGKRIDTTNAVERYDFLEVCHGIRMVYHRNRTIEELLSIVKTELEAKRPCALHIDSYELTWDAGYQRWHTNHVIMPQEITEDSIKLMNPYNYRINLEFPIQQLCANTTKFCITFEVKPEPFYNNVGFATLDHSGIADFTGVGEFFLYNERVEKYQWKDQGVEYLMKPYEFNKEDNIACKGQIIEVPQVMAKKIGFLATAEWGSYYEEVTVVYQDQSTERYYIGLTDFANFPRYGETIVYQGPTGMKEKDGVSPWQTEARIFSVIKAIKPGKIIRIQLPNCERVHIFGITLVDGEE